jgi:hypothetical protein
MRFTKIPIPLLIAALVATTAIVVYLQLAVVPVPVVADSNFTTTLVGGTPYLWRGAASEITVTSNATIQLTYMPVTHVVYVNGPLGNASLGGNWIVYLRGGRPILVQRVTALDGSTYHYLFKLVNTSKVGGLSVLVPQTFGASETISDAEARAIYTITGRNGLRVVNIYTNGTHIALDVAPHNSTAGLATHYFRLPPAVNTTSTKITSSGYGVSYTVNGTTVSVYLMPYHYIVIIPRTNVRVTIVVR